MAKLNQLKMDELRDLCGERDLEFVSLTRNEMIYKLIEHDKHGNTDSAVDPEEGARDASTPKSDNGDGGIAMSKMDISQLQLELKRLELEERRMEMK